MGFQKKSIGAGTLARPHKILIVDDENAILFAVKQYFTQAGYQVDCAQDVMDAKALPTAIDYSLVITDLCLTGGHDADGLEVIRYARERRPHTPVILMTAHGSPEIERQAQQRGADAILNKPVSLPHLAQVVAGLLGTASERTHI